MEFSKKTRELSIQKMQERTLDLLIIGGGITGAGVALQAAASGLDTGLIEMQDFAEGTSSRSTKLVHGGLRYLKQFDVEVVSDTVSERAVVQQIAPHIPKPDPMLLPVFDEDGATFSLFRLKVAMDLYDLLAGVNNTPAANKVLSKEDFIKATLQSIAYQVRDIIDTMQVDSQTAIQVLKVDGGAAMNNFLMQFQADILGIDIARAKNLETTALGAAFLAGLAVGYWKDLDELKLLNETGELFEPSMNESRKEQLYKGWKKAVKATQVFAEIDD